MNAFNIPARSLFTDEEKLSMKKAAAGSKGGRHKHESTDAKAAQYLPPPGTNAFTAPRKPVFTTPEALREQAYSQRGKRGGAVRAVETKGTVPMIKPRSKP